MTTTAAATAAHPDPAKAQIAGAYRAHEPEVLAIARAIHADPEIAFTEHRAQERCADLLERAGFTLERGIADLPTAFRATIGEGSLVASLCVEYDALPELGHGCGHNLIAGASLGAALALAEQVAQLDLTLVVIGTPAEEHGGGKQLLIDRGAFDGVHLSLMTHPTPHTDTYDPIGSTSQAVGRWRATYTGRGAHAAANPSDGINANDAAVVAQVAAGLLRQRIRDGQRLALIPIQTGITNIIPETAVIDFECRALTMPEFELLREQLFACLEAGAVATGASVEIVGTEPVYEPLRQDEGLGQAWNDAMTVLGRPLRGSLGAITASTDMGNVSQRVPSLHPFVGITGAGGALHTREFAEHADSPEGYRLMADAAVAMAWVIHDVATDPQLQEGIRARAEQLAATDARAPQP
ncbi:MAG TPA: amidohydrolase [Candidatus Brachybacterium merdavium]|uniref:Peptidase M20 domain-containing protein 2 n=1 Tax=Candidatus Brachybacterium merdavium TaxID=2838513 RepID=A0A9D2LD31_9MICO|nr:amidohydrolase [Candidatus Brachybacterium merdavium]